MKKYLILLLLFSKTGTAQQTAFPKDTSFSIQATYLKEVKKHPQIKIATPAHSKKVKQKNDIAYRNIGGRDLLLDIFYPEKTKHRKPAILLVYGGGWRSGEKTHNYAMATELANNGYVAVTAEYRLSLEALYPAAVYDLKAAIRWMRSHAEEYEIDTAKIAVLGCSAGGQLVALMGTTNNNPAFEDKIGDSNHSSVVQAVINIDGILAFKHPESSEGASASLWLGGTYEQNPENWKQASALTHVDKSTVPFLFINSSIPRFHAGRDDMIAKMDALGIYSEVHTMPDSPHPFWFFHPWFESMMKYILEFSGKRLK